MSNKEIPERYFEDLPDKILQKLSREEHQRELQEWTKMLITIPKKNPYIIPQNYFEELALTSTVMHRPKARKLWPIISSVAACAIIMIMVLSNTADNEFQMSDTDIIDYYAENTTEVYTDELAELVYADELDDKVSIEDAELEEIIASLSDYELELFHELF